MLSPFRNAPLVATTFSTFPAGVAAISGMMFSVCSLVVVSLFRVTVAISFDFVTPSVGGKDVRVTVNAVVA